MLVDFDDQFYLDVALRLVSNSVQIPCIITSMVKDYKKNKLFNRSRLFDPLLFAYPKNIKKLNVKNSESLSTEIIEKSIEYENMFLTVSDRLNFFPLPVRNRKQIYQQLLLYWYSFFKKNPVDAVVFASTPHMGFYNVIYGVAKMLNVKIVYLYRTLIENKILLLNDYKKVEKVPEGYLKNKTKKELIELIGADYYKQIFVPSLWIKRSDNINKKAINQNVSFLLKEYVAVTLRFFRFLFQGQPTSVFYYNNGCNKFLIGLLCLWVNFKLNRLRRYYQGRTTKVNLNKKFVYFPFHFQPEKTTCPEGGVFENQLLAVDILSKSIPKDWILYIKEHPRQFEINDPRRLHYRDKDYYNTLLGYKNVRLVRIEKNSEPLMKQAIFTVTITGSSGWQSLLANKPCVVFGNPWYSPCRSCYVVNSVDECKRTVTDIIDKSSKEVEKDVLRYLSYYKNRFVTSTNAHYFAIQSGLNYHDLVNNLANNLIKQVYGRKKNHSN
jgi:hypothetical protein